MPRLRAIYSKTLKITGQLLTAHNNNIETKGLQEKLHVTLWTAKHSRNIYKLQIAEIGVYIGYAGLR